MLAAVGGLAIGAAWPNMVTSVPVRAATVYGNGVAAGNTCTYTTTGEDAFTVPAGVTSVQVTATGGAGGAGATTAPGAGGAAATVTAEVAIPQRVTAQPARTVNRGFRVK